MSGWISFLASLPPVVAIVLLFGWSKRNDNKSKVKEEEARIELIKVLASEWVHPITKGLDANTEAVKESVKHNEEIVKNHLSGQARRDEARAQQDEILIREMKDIAAAIEKMNGR